MYKSTRHTRKTWTYKSESVFSPWYGTEEEGRKIVERSREVLFNLRLLAPEDFVFQTPVPPLSFTFSRLVNERLRRGRAFLRKRGLPQALINSLPNYFVISPKLGTVVARLARLTFHQVPSELREFFNYLQANGPLENPRARPVFSAGAIVVRAAEAKAMEKRASASASASAVRSLSAGVKKQKKTRRMNGDDKPTPETGARAGIATPTSMSASSLARSASGRKVGLHRPLNQRIQTKADTETSTALSEAFRRALGKS